MYTKVIGLCFLVLPGVCSAVENETEYYEERIPDEQRLFQEIMEGYEIAVRPVANTSGVIVVRFGLRLNQIIELDERHQILTTNVFIDQVWNDPSLSWNPADFNNVQSIRIPSYKVWLPDTFIYNNADGRSTGFVAGQYVLVSHTGDVLWPVPVKLRSSCQVDIKYFPFDDQQCILRFGSWIYNDDALSFLPLKDTDPVDMMVYVNNSEWDLLSVSLERNRRGESCCVEPHTDLVYRLNIRRRTFFYIFNVIIPCIMLSVLTLLTFWVPATSGEKVTLGLSVFLAFSMFMLLIAEEVPASSESVPLIGIYLCCVMTMTSFSVIMAVLVINLYHRGVRTPRAPAWLRCLCLRVLSTLICISHDIQAIAETITLDEERDDGERVHGRKGRAKKKRNGKNGYSQGNGQTRGRHQVEVHPRKAHRTDIRNRNITWRDYNRPHDRQLAETHLDNIPAVQCPTPSTSNHEAMDAIFEQPDQQGSPPGLLETDMDQVEKDELADQADASSQEGYENHEKFHDDNDNPCKDEAQALLSENQEHTTENASAEELFQKKVAIAEWQRIAAVIDRLLFWVFFLGTLTAYLIILVIIPENKKIPWDTDISPLHAILHQV